MAKIIVCCLICDDGVGLHERKQCFFACFWIQRSEDHRSINGWEALCNMTENTVNGGERVHY